MSLTILSCKKIDFNYSDQSSKSKIIAELKIAYQEKRLATINRYSNLELDFMPLWQEAILEKNNLQQDLLIIPVKYSKKIVCETNYQKNFYKPFDSIVQLKCLKNNNGNWDIKLQYKFIRKDRNQDVQYILHKDLEGNLISTHMLKDNKMYVLKNSRTNTISARERECLVYSLYNCNGEPEAGFTNCTLVYQSVIFCIGENEQPYWTLDPGDTGGGSSNFHEYFDCNTWTEQEVNEVLSNSYGYSIQNINTIAENDLGVDANFIARKEKIIEFEFFEYRFNFLFIQQKAKYTSFYNCLLKKLPNDNLWRFENIIYQSTGLTSGITVPCFSVSCTVNARNEVISTDKLKAYLTIYYSYTAQVSCLSGKSASQTNSGHSISPIYANE